MVDFGRSCAFDFSEVLRPGDHVAWPQGTGEPTGLTARLADQAAALPQVTLVLGMVTSPTLSLPGMESFGYLCLNGAANTRKAVAWSGNRVVPAHLSAIPGLISSRHIPVDIALIRVRPTAEPGIYSLGVMVDYVHEMIRAARVVVAELDERMPLTSGDTLVSADAIHHIVMADGAMPEITDPIPGEIDIAVARNVVEIIPDRATVQFGVGGLPVAVAQALGSHKDLGLHSGIITDAAIDLIASGVINNRFKGIDAGASVTGGLFGTQRLFDFAHMNPSIQMRPSLYTHGAATLAKLNAFYSVNSAIAIDLSGQVNAEVAGGRYLGAVGGQVDFVRGARLSSGGRSIIALASTTPDGKTSKIVPNLVNQPVTTGRSDVDIVVTEFGVAELWGRDLPARAKAMASIAHPNFREDLLRALNSMRSQ
jgi:acetyl-CoA hydrolase